MWTCGNIEEDVVLFLTWLKNTLVKICTFIFLQYKAEYFWIIYISIFVLVTIYISIYHTKFLIWHVLDLLKDN